MTASKMIKSLLKSVPLDWVLPVVFEMTLSKIKKDSKADKAFKEIVLPFANEVKAHYEGE